MAATNPENDDPIPSDVVIYIMPQRIQKSMLQDIKNGVKRKNLCMCEKYGEGVSHIVTQYTDRGQVVSQLRRDGAKLKDDKLEGVKVVSLAWLSACLKAGGIVRVEGKHLVKDNAAVQKTQETKADQGSDQGRATQPVIPAWACQRSAPLNHFNHRFTEALEILEQHAEFRNGSSDYSRALAFRRASCVLKSLPCPVHTLAQVQGLRDVGGHALKVIQSILEEGECEEVQQVKDEWFSLMKEFTSVFGVGPATAKKWIEKGWKSIEEVRQSDSFGKDERVNWGLAFYEDLTSPVSVTEADMFVQIVKTEAEKILPGVIVTLMGGFRRGKQSGHDVDILMTHPQEGQELGLLTAVLQALDRKGLVLMGRSEASTYTPECLTTDSKLLAMRGQLDHFEKWLGICRFEPTKQTTTSGREDHTNIVAGTCDKKPGTHHEKSGMISDGTNSDKSSSNPEVALKSRNTDSCVQESEHPHQNTHQDPNPKHHSDDHHHHSQARMQGTHTPEKPHSTPKHKADSDDDAAASQPQAKHLKTSTGKAQSPFQLARADRAWRARRVDLIVSPFSQYYYAVVGWTGNKHFNRDLRLYAQKELGMKLTSHGLWDYEKHREVPARSEAEVFHNLKLQYREPRDRNC